uniref:C2H2-type domain-containing protein n=1 Tax=Capitella teleta TaxID=283909 RepID=X2A7W0_CAPTE
MHFRQHLIHDHVSQVLFPFAAMSCVVQCLYCLEVFESAASLDQHKNEMHQWVDEEICEEEEEMKSINTKSDIKVEKDASTTINYNDDDSCHEEEQILTYIKSEIKEENDDSNDIDTQVALKNEGYCDEDDLGNECEMEMEFKGKNVKLEVETEIIRD